MAIGMNATSCGCGPDDTSCVSESTFTEREKTLLNLGIAMTLNQAKSIKEAILEAILAGITNDEISFVSEAVSALQGSCGCSPSVEEKSGVSVPGASSSCCS